ncbi:hypothetical protein M3Y96_00793400 [Aphelenchoides besseyi]|nr:hypothetical protein M3Y96_00793400 [Aphelenchoides besseyi]
MWFDAFRDNGAPTSYGENRTGVIFDLKLVILMSIFVIPSIALLIILPGIRQLRCFSSTIILFSMAVGGSIVVALNYPCWQQAEARIFTPYKTFSSNQMDAVLGVKIGLTELNITLNGHVLDGVLTLGTSKLFYNERFDFMPGALAEALKRGVPFPLIKTIEYLSVDDNNGFEYGRLYRMGGYYTSILLWFSLLTWFLQITFLLFCPQKFGSMSVITGVTLITSNIVYAVNVPSELCIKFPGHFGQIAVLDFKMSHCFYSTLITGTLNLVFGLVVVLAQKRGSYVFETFLCPNFHTARRIKRLQSLPPPRICLSNRSLHEWSLLFGNKPDLNSLRNFCLSGCLRDSRIRSIVWRVLLRVVSPEPDSWPSDLAARRTSYEKLKADLNTNPRSDEVTDNLDVNNPLSLQNESPWQQYFNDETLRESIRKDVDRAGLTPIDLNILTKINNANYLEHDAFFLFSHLMIMIKPWYADPCSEIFTSSATNEASEEASKLLFKWYFYTTTKYHLKSLGFLAADYTSALLYCMHYPPVDDVHQFIRFVLYLKSPLFDPPNESQTVSSDGHANVVALQIRLQDALDRADIGAFRILEAASTLERCCPNQKSLAVELRTLAAYIRGESIDDYWHFTDRRSSISKNIRPLETSSANRSRQNSGNPRTSQQSTKEMIEMHFARKKNF